MITEQTAKEALQAVMDPELGKNIVELGMARDIIVTDGVVAFTLALTTMACPLRGQMQDDAKSALLKLAGVKDVQIRLAEMTHAEKAKLAGSKAPEGLAAHLNHAKHVIAVMSGKGGVGKSLVTGLLATALRRKGHDVGVLDADITGPSIPKMFFPNGARPGMSPVAMLPAETKSGIRVMSINLLLDREDQAVMWRGPLIGGTIRQFWTDVVWGELDYLVVDLPPGTSDASLTVLQSLPMSGVLLVTSPQGLAGMVVRKAAELVNSVNVPILGLVENMSYFVCPETGKQHDIFGPSHAEATARQLNIPFLGRLPIDPQIAPLCDGGRIETYQNSLFDTMAEQVTALTTEARAPIMQ